MRRLVGMLIVGVGMAVGTSYIDKVSATPASGFSGTTIAKGRFEDIDVFNQSVQAWLPRPWISIQKTKGPSDLWVQNNDWEVGGTTGWHTHPGHSLIIVTAGAITVYEGDDPLCTPHVYTGGLGFVDPGGDHAHVLRNEGTVQARTVAVQLVAADAMRRIDAPANSACTF